MNLKVLKDIVSDRLILPEDERYNEARKIYNGMIDKYPSAILKCETEQDVLQGISFARSNKIDVAIKGGGHNGAGLAMCDEGLVIDLSNMKNIIVDSEK